MHRKHKPARVSVSSFTSISHLLQASHISKMSFISGLPHRSSPYFSVGHFFRVLNASVFGLEPFENTAGFKLENYDVDYATGFFPPEPLPRLSGQFELWERALDDAEGNISLGEDTRESAKAKRPYVESWRERVRTVSIRD